ncbi:orotidine 5-phosphate decarboxylase [uncultured Tateyamaria sp.]|uniref:orotidine 5-phosphate decarboxylase n=1 Tax=uncultured Tateyamaria sp. TaxID=455651 RepID=UPI002611A283|nr:orotidine 5-phosphate decarboxylase [uncultured Tateyamaria sp.]
MQTVPLQLSDVIYNAATQSFEALVTVHDAQGPRSYACAIDAPITMEFEDAAEGLATQAMRRHTHGRSDAVHMPAAMAPRRTNRLAGLRRMTIDKFAVLRPRAA